MGFKPEVTMSRPIHDMAGGEDYYTQIMVETNEQCRTHCEHDGLCVAASATVKSEGLVCSLYNEGHFKRMPDEHSTFYRKNKRSGKQKFDYFAFCMNMLLGEIVATCF